MPYRITDHEDDESYLFWDLDAYLMEWNDTMETGYKTMEEFNKGEGFRTISLVTPNDND